jgi:hypothetical protein
VRRSPTILGLDEHLAIDDGGSDIETGCGTITGWR